MKLTKEQLKRIIKEELSSINEGWTRPFKTVKTKDPDEKPDPDKLQPGLDDWGEDLMSDKPRPWQQRIARDKLRKEEFGQVNEGDKVTDKISYFKQNPDKWARPDDLEELAGLWDTDERAAEDRIRGGGFSHTDTARDIYKMAGGWDMDGSRERLYPGWDDDDFRGLVIKVDGYDLFNGKNPYWREGDYFEEQKMKLTKEQLQRIIKEELQAVMSEEMGEIIPHAADRRDWQEKMDDAYRQANPGGPIAIWSTDPGPAPRPEQLFLNWMAKQYTADEQEIYDLRTKERNIYEALWRIWNYTEGQGVGSDFADSNLVHARKAIEGTDYEKHGSGYGSEQEGWEGIVAKADHVHGRMDET